MGFQREGEGGWNIVVGSTREIECFDAFISFDGKDTDRPLAHRHHHPHLPGNVTSTVLTGGEMEQALRSAGNDVAVECRVVWMSGMP